jgi:acetyl-CoA carboxylase carboxyltransferase component
MVQIDEKSYGLSKERLESIFDSGTFVELGAYTKRTDSQTDFESVVCGYGAVDGKLAFAFVQDSGRTKGAFGERHAKKIAAMYALAVKNGAPVIGVFDSAGAVVYDGASALAAYGTLMKQISNASGIIPQIAVIDGVCGGASAVAASMFDFTVTIKEKSKFFVNAPFVVGTAETAEKQGLSAYEAENEASAFAFVRQLIATLPQNNAEASFTDSADSPNRQVNVGGCGNAHELVATLADDGKFTELYAGYTDQAVLGFASFGGVLSGVICSETKTQGLVDISLARAASKLISFCDSFGIPVLTLVDSEGLDVSLSAENHAYASELARLAFAYTTSENAKVTVVMGKAYGAAFTLLGSKSVGADMALALPDACISVLSPEASVAFVWNDRVGEQSREELEAEWKEKCASAMEAMDAGEIDDLVAPTELRQRICAALNMLAAKAEGIPSRKHANLPL